MFVVRGSTYNGSIYTKSNFVTVFSHYGLRCMRDLSTMMKFQDVVICFVTPCSGVVGYRRFRGPCCLR